MDCNWTDLVPGLDAEPEHSLVALDASGSIGAIPEQPQGCIVNWDELLIVRQDEEGEGRLEFVDEDQLYVLLGLATEDAHDKDTADAAPNEDQATTNNGNAVPDIDTRGAAIPVDDEIPEERVMVHDPNKPCMDLGTVYPNMVEFRLAVRQFAINEEFALDTVKTDKTRFIGKCMAPDCPWHINGRKQRDSNTVMKRKRKPRTNTTKYGKNGNKKTKKTAENPPVQAENVAVQPDNTPVQAENVAVHHENVHVRTEDVTAKETILATTPERLTRSRLALLLGEGSSAAPSDLSPNKQATTSPKPKKKARNSPKLGIAKKLVPRKLKTN